MGAIEQIKSEPLYILITHGNSTILEKSFDFLPITIGRSAHCHISLSDFNWISRQHAVIICENNKLYLVDLKSSNGIQIGGQTYDRIEIDNGTVANIGTLTLQFSIPNKNIKHQKPSLYSNDKNQSATIIPSPPPQVIQAQTDDDRTLVDSLNITQSTPTNARRGRYYPELDSSVAEIESFPPTHQPSYFNNQKHPQENLALADTLKPNVIQTPDKKNLHRDQLKEYEKQQNSPLKKKYPLNFDKPIENIDKVARDRRVLETYVTWKGNVFDTQLFWPGEQVVVGRTTDGVYLPTLKGEYFIAHFDGAVARCSIPPDPKGYLQTGNYQPVPLEELIKSQAFPKHGKNYILKLGSTDLCSIDIAKDLQIHLRYAPAPRQLARKRMIEPDALLKRALSGSSLVHFLIIGSFIFLGPSERKMKTEEAPRTAKILLKKEELKKEEPPPPPPPPPPEKKEEVKPEPKPKEKPKVKPPKVKPTPQPKKITRPNKTKDILPSKKITKNEGSDVPIPSKKEEPDVTKVGALAALGALGASTPNPTQQPVAINVNQNAGGGGAKISTDGVIGALKASGGKLQAAGISGVKTQGKGFGTGTGYGVQGIKGSAGTRGVGGSVVGSPQLMKINRTEGLNRKQVMDVVKQYVAEIQQCYEKSLLTDPGISGRVEYEWYITPEGSVNWAKVKKSDIRGGDHLNNCVIAIFKKMKFPVAKNGESTQPNIGFPFGRL